MTAQIIPFHRPVAQANIVASQTTAPPLITHTLNESEVVNRCKFVGTKEQLVSWRIADESDFPQGRSRIKRNQRIHVSRFSGGRGLFKVTCYVAGDLDTRARLKGVIEQMRRCSSNVELAAGAALEILQGVRQAVMFKKKIREAGHFEEYDSGVRMLEHSLAAAFVLIAQQAALQTQGTEVQS